MDDKDFINRRDIPAVAISTLKEAKASVSFTSSYQLKQTSQKLLSAGLKEDMEIKLDSLQVQSKFKDSIQLEESTHLWRRIIDGMPAGQLSLILS
jgi:molybdenum cofactor biosynthesis enzyme MoaA